MKFNQLNVKGLNKKKVKKIKKNNNLNQLRLTC
jgi:hypothetical protein